MRDYTKGPWIADAFSLSFEIRALNNPLIAVVQSRHCDTPEEMTANAQLIAAAPELLEALKLLFEKAGDIKANHEMSQKHPDLLNAFVVADKAINKAEGRS